MSNELSNGTGGGYARASHAPLRRIPGAGAAVLLVLAFAVSASAQSANTPRLEVTRLTPTSVSLAWTRSTLADFHHYEVRCSPTTDYRYFLPVPLRGMPLALALSVLVAALASSRARRAGRTAAAAAILLLPALVLADAGDWLLVHAISDRDVTTFDDSGLAPGTTLFYRVLMVGIDGAIASTNEVQATPGAAATAFGTGSTDAFGEAVLVLETAGGQRRAEIACRTASETEEPLAGVTCAATLTDLQLIVTAIDPSGAHFAATSRYPAGAFPPPATLPARAVTSTVLLTLRSRSPAAETAALFGGADSWSELDLDPGMSRSCYEGAMPRLVHDVLELVAGSSDPRQQLAGTVSPGVVEQLALPVAATRAAVSVMFGAGAQPVTDGLAAAGFPADQDYSLCLVYALDRRDVPLRFELREVISPSRDPRILSLQIEGYRGAIPVGFIVADADSSRVDVALHYLLLATDSGDAEHLVCAAIGSTSHGAISEGDSFCGLRDVPVTAAGTAVRLTLDSSRDFPGVQKIVRLQLLPRDERPLGFGEKIFSGAIAIDNSGSTDTTRPEVRLTAPADHATVIGAVELRAVVSDDTGFRQVDFYQDAGAGETLIGTDTAPQAEAAVTWETASLPPGEYVVSAVATDLAGLSARSTITVTTTGVASACENGECLVPEGTFAMGCDSSQGRFACEPWEAPVHAVTLNAYFIDELEVTTGAYASWLNGAGIDHRTGCSDTASTSGYACVQTRDEDPDSHILWDGLAYTAEADFENYPLTEVTWYGARTFCQSQGKRLPTEAEWEKAARSLDGRIFPWGAADPVCDLTAPNGAKFDDDAYCNATGAVPVGSFPAAASPYGVLDLAGNAWEIVNDYYDAGYYAQSPPNDPSGPADGTDRVIRGGSAADSEGALRGAYRSWGGPTATDVDTGFRCARAAVGP
ncbi:MAG: SUMF1/EgtB/PvdO family nonheme iron enzyme [Candidatus Schekmanbacteria bacterium]|nr:SUMF1/EgtB/PvdO family nonheme iron enzyme [Candidatus Schekmanbacteria bacterium]